LFHAIVGLGLAGTAAACGSSTEVTPDGGGEPGATDAATDATGSDSGADAGADATSIPPFNQDAGHDSALPDTDGWVAVPIR
jgi:hypothetical protein